MPYKSYLEKTKDPIIKYDDRVFYLYGNVPKDIFGR
jgi:hypothetical protein